MLAFSRLVVGCAVVTLAVDAASADERPLLPFLEARAESSDGSSRGTLTFTQNGTEERAGFAREMHRLADFAEAHHPEVNADSVRKNAALYETTVPSDVGVFRFVCRPGDGWTKLEHLWNTGWTDGPRPAAFTVARHILICNGVEWKTLTPQIPAAVNTPRGPVPATVNVDDQSTGRPILLAALGRGIPVEHCFSDPMFAQRGLSVRAQLTGVLPWKEALQLLDTRSAREETVPTPLLGRALRMLELHSHFVAKWEAPIYRLRVWFSPDDGFALAALESAQYQPVGTGGGPEFVRTVALEWTDPAPIHGETVYRRCVFRPYVFSQAPPESAAAGAVTDEKLFPTRSFAVVEQVFEFSDLSTGTATDDEFEIQLLKGTTVTDQVAGQAYVIGSGGERLDQRAVTQRKNVTEPTLTHWWTYVAGGLAAMALALAVFALRRRT